MFQWLKPKETIKKWMFSRERPNNIYIQGTPSTTISLWESRIQVNGIRKIRHLLFIK